MRYLCHICHHETRSWQSMWLHKQRAHKKEDYRPLYDNLPEDTPRREGGGGRGLMERLPGLNQQTNEEE